MKSGFWKSDWFLGLALALLVFFASGSDLLQSLERKAYDMGVQASSRTPSDRVAVIAIDDQSIANIGRWPWPRSPPSCWRSGPHRFRSSTGHGPRPPRSRPPT